jgi:hypothetical protein
MRWRDQLLHEWNRPKGATYEENARIEQDAEGGGDGGRRNLLLVLLWKSLSG